MPQKPGFEGPHDIHRGRRYSVRRTSRQDHESLIIKSVRPGPLAAASAAMLRHEYALLLELQALEVPGVVRPFALEEDLAEGLALVLEDAGPRNLQEWLARRPLELDTFLVLAPQLATILAGLHQHRVIHRDINPTNLVLAEDGLRLTLIDFDSSTKEPDLLSPGGMPEEFQWTLPYVAPEQTGRTNHPIDHRADLYSLGVTFYQMLTGAPPFVSPDPVELVHAHLARPPVPPSLANPAVPALLSDLVLKLLAKTPAERYQSAEALLADLEEARRRHAAGVLSPFELGRVDLARQLPLPNRLHGREREVELLRETLRRVRAGASELVMITGPPGAGKSSLVHALRGHVEPADHFLTGKFNQLQGTVPYAPFVEVFQQLARELLALPVAEQERWRARVGSALGPHGRLLGDIVPELQQLLGEQPPLMELGPVEAENRLHLVIQAFLQSLASPEGALVLFLDDLQWADPASLKLLKSLAQEPDSRGILLLGAFRSDDAAADKLIPSLLESLQREDGMSVRTLALLPLELPSVTAFCGEVLHCEPARVDSLARLVLSKTAGNPFFMTRLLRFLHQSGLLSFNVDRDEWEWDLARIEQVGVSENVVELMLAAIRRLPGRAQRVLKVAASLGDREELWLLSALMGEPPDDTVSVLGSLFQEGLLTPEPVTARPPDAPKQGFAYRFAHDRVRQAAYMLLSEEERARLHHAAGRLLLQKEPGERLFAIVDHLSLGLSQVGGLVERLELADLHYRAGLKAKVASAMEAAQVYLTRGIQLFPRELWPSHRERVFQLHKEAAECAYLAGDSVLASQLVSVALEHAASRVERADVYVTQVLASVVKMDYPGAVRQGREGVRLFGMELPERELSQALSTVLAEVDTNRRGRSMDELLHAPLMTNPEHISCMRLLSELIAPSMTMGQEFFTFIVASGLNLSLKYGNCVHSPMSYTWYGTYLANARHDYTEGQAFGLLGVELARRLNAPAQECRALCSLAFDLNHWKAPLRTSLPLLRRSIAAGTSSLEIQALSYAFVMVASTEFALGTELPRVLDEIHSALAFLRKFGTPAMRAGMRIFQQAIRCLQGQTREWAHFSDDSLDEEAFLASLRDPSITRGYYVVTHLQVSYLLGDLDEALRMSRMATTLLNALPRFFYLAQYHFYTALTLAARCERVPSERADNLARLETHQSQLAAWARACPENFRHKHALVEAELARLEGHVVEAMQLYDQAIDAAHGEGFLQEEALAHELAGRFYHALGRRRFAGLHLRTAINAYIRWGARAKSLVLEEEFPDLEPVEELAWSTTPLPTTTGAPQGASLDLHSILKASATLSSEVVLSRLLEKLMVVCFEAAGATRGALILAEEDSLVVRASGAPPELVVLERTPLATSDEVPRTAIEHAWRTGETSVLADAAHHGRFVNDPYIIRHAVKSALIIPIQRTAATIGVLYLENHLTTRAFTPERVGVLRLLSSQIAISLDNSLLFGKLRVEVQERRRAEQSVRFLADSSLALSESLDLEVTLARVTRLVVPFLADWCVITEVDKEEQLRPLAMAHADPSKEGVLRELVEKFPPSWDSPAPLGRTLRTGEPFVRPEVSSTLLGELGYHPEYIQMMREVEIQTAMHVPLIARGKTLGAITFASSAAGRRYGEAELDLAMELARRAAVCIDNARLFREAQEAIRLREDFLSVASHELNTPLTSLRLAVQGLFRRSTAIALPQPMTRGLQIIDQQAKRLATLISELFDVSQLQAGRLELHLEEVDLAAILRDVLEQFEELLARAECPVTIRVDGRVVGRWDRSRLEQVLTHLLSNAIKFGPGKPIELTLERKEEHVRLVVRDHGMGIEPKLLPSIFERLSRGVSARKFGGLGLGLHLVREIVTRLGGTVRAESTAGVGTALTVELPCAGPVSLEEATGGLASSAS
ncbi:AAA family ATPase [Archangium violaceum]|uniref:AAA family ATPase n=1 Tax=Archangium violaceum TaxID=83451 RepID=UPI0036DD7E87